MDADMLIDINMLTFGLFKIQDPTLNYYPGYIAAGMSANFTNSTLLKDAHPVVKALFGQEYKSN